MERFVAGDPLRALAALMIVVVHAALQITFFGGGESALFGSAGQDLLVALAWGVSVFFVLSGYLIARPFVRAIVEGEPLPRVRNYLVNRALRILPAYWVVLTAMLLIYGAARVLAARRGRHVPVRPGALRRARARAAAPDLVAQRRGRLLPRGAARRAGAGLGHARARAPRAARRRRRDARRRRGCKPPPAPGDRRLHRALREALPLAPGAAVRLRSRHHPRDARARGRARTSAVGALGGRPLALAALGLAGLAGSWRWARIPPPTAACPYRCSPPEAPASSSPRRSCSSGPGDARGARSTTARSVGSAERSYSLFLIHLPVLNALRPRVLDVASGSTAFVLLLAGGLTLSLVLSHVSYELWRSRSSAGGGPGAGLSRPGRRRRGRAPRRAARRASSKSSELDRRRRGVRVRALARGAAGRRGAGAARRGTKRRSRSGSRRSSASSLLALAVDQLGVARASRTGPSSSTSAKSGAHSARSWSRVVLDVVVGVDDLVGAART